MTASKGGGAERRPVWPPSGTMCGRNWEVAPEGALVRLYVGRPDGDRLAVLLGAPDVRALVEALTVTADALPEVRVP